MSQFKHTLSDEVQEGVTLQGREIWRPAVAEPMWVGFGLKTAQCGCGEKFKSRQAFKEHYIYQAVWENESNYIPELIAKERASKK